MVEMDWRMCVVNCGLKQRTIGSKLGELFARRREKIGRWEEGESTGVSPAAEPRRSRSQNGRMAPNMPECSPALSAKIVRAYKCHLYRWQAVFSSSLIIFISLPQLLRKFYTIPPPSISTTSHFCYGFSHSRDHQLQLNFKRVFSDACYAAKRTLRKPNDVRFRACIPNSVASHSKRFKSLKWTQV